MVNPEAVLLFDAPLTLREFVTQEPLPLATVFREVLTYLAGCPDAVVFGAHAVNAYCEPERMTADVDVLSTEARSLAENLRELIATRFHCAAPVRKVADGGFRVYQVRKPRNRPLVDVRHVAILPPHRTLNGVRVVEPADLAAMKAIAVAARQGHEKGLTDRLDLHRLLRVFPELGGTDGPVALRLRALSAPVSALDAWNDIQRQPLRDDDDDDDDES